MWWPLGGLQLCPRPLVLLWYGTSLAGAAGTALGLAARHRRLPVCCCAGPRQGAARLLDEEESPHRGHRHRAAAGAHRGGRHAGGSTPVD
ncbi:hypothetical protein ACRAWF_05200 [Streptomyces sp. L7]